MPDSNDTLNSTAATTPPDPPPPAPQVMPGLATGHEDRIAALEAKVVALEQKVLKEHEANLTLIQEAVRKCQAFLGLK